MENTAIQLVHLETKECQNIACKYQIIKDRRKDSPQSHSRAWPNWHLLFVLQALELWDNKTWLFWSDCVSFSKEKRTVEMGIEMDPETISSFCHWPGKAVQTSLSKHVLSVFCIEYFSAAPRDPVVSNSGRSLPACSFGFKDEYYWVQKFRFQIPTVVGLYSSFIFKTPCQRQ